MADIVVTPLTYTVECRTCGARWDGLRDHEVRRFQQDHEHREVRD